MSIIQSPPDTGKTLVMELQDAEFLNKIKSSEIQKVLQKANYDYVPWEKFQYWILPVGFSHEVVWAYLKLGRFANRKILPLMDKLGNSFSYWSTDSMLKRLNGIDMWSGGTITADRRRLPPKNKKQYIISSRMEEAIASSQLEGAATTRQIAKEMLRSGRRPANINEQMILNNWETMQYIRSNSDTELTPEKLMEIHRLVTEKTISDPLESGRLRMRDDIIVSYNDETVHIPPLSETLPQRLEALCQFANTNDDAHWIHPVIKGAIIHFGLAYDHPFTDGNGRTARALMYWYLLSRGYSLFEYIAISRYFLRAHGQYARAYLYTETDDNDLNYFLEYNLRAITLAIKDMQLYLTRKQNEIHLSNELLESYRGLNARQKILIYHAIQHRDARYIIEEHKNYYGIVYQTARMDLLNLVTKGFLKKRKEGHGFVFLPHDGMIESLRAKEVKVAKMVGAKAPSLF